GSGPYDLISSLDCKDVEDGNHVNFSVVQTSGSHFSLNNQTLQLINSKLP
ncbi:protocadherin Fat 4, partial [Biomphalaria glabrata]